MLYIILNIYIHIYLYIYIFIYICTISIFTSEIKLLVLYNIKYNDGIVKTKNIGIKNKINRKKIEKSNTLK